MKKAVTYMRYLAEYLRHGDFMSVVSSVKYIINKTSHSRNRIIHTSIGTFYCRKNTNDFQFANYHYEWGVKKFILKRINEFTVFIDGGACIGDYCILLAKHNMRCIAFEPIAENYAAMIKNLQLNNLICKVKVFYTGLSNENKPARFHFNPVNTGASYIDRNENETSYKGELRTFDSMFEKLKIGKEENILFKLDVEGMEPEALLGSAEFIRQYPNLTFVIEDKHVGDDPIKSLLSHIAEFEFGIVDEYNFYARKINNLN